MTTHTPTSPPIRIPGYTLADIRTMVRWYTQKEFNTENSWNTQKEHIDNKIAPRRQELNWLCETERRNEIFDLLYRRSKAKIFIRFPANRNLIIAWFLQKIENLFINTNHRMISLVNRKLSPLFFWLDNNFQKNYSVIIYIMRPRPKPKKNPWPKLKKTV